MRDSRQFAIGAIGTHTEPMDAIIQCRIGRCVIRCITPTTFSFLRYRDRPSDSDTRFDPPPSEFPAGFEILNVLAYQMTEGAIEVFFEVYPANDTSSQFTQDGILLATDANSVLLTTSNQVLQNG